jgi:hypothetical protein
MKNRFQWKSITLVWPNPYLWDKDKCDFSYSYHIFYLLNLSFIICQYRFFNTLQINQSIQ